MLCVAQGHHGTRSGRPVGVGRDPCLADDQVHPERPEQPAGKLADAERIFSGGPFDGLKLIGFASGSGAAAAGR